MTYKNSYKLRLIFLLSIFVVISTIIPSNNLYNPTFAATQSEAFQAITTAYEKIREASTEGIDVSDLIEDLNQALEDYNDGKYNSAYDIANQVITEADDLLSNIRWGKVFPYILIPVNIVLVAAIIVFFGRNMLGWYRTRRDDEYMDLEIDYDSLEKHLTITSSEGNIVGEKNEQ